MRKILVIFFFIHHLLIKSEQNSKIDLLIFSRDRSMQLYAFFESCEKYVNGLNKIYLIYYASNQNHLNSYEKIYQRFKNLHLTMIQEKKPKLDFKNIVISILRQANEFILFAVDDIIITQKINLNDCLEIIKKLDLQFNINGFYFRLGKNISHSYPNNKIKQPKFININDDIYLWKFNEATGDWNYPNTLDMTLFKTDKVKNEIENLNFNSPNTLEGEWSKIANLNNYGICCEHSKTVNIPANLVQKDWINPIFNSFSNEELQKKFDEGYKIDINQFFNLNNTCPHSNEIYDFIKQ